MVQFHCYSYGSSSKGSLYLLECNNQLIVLDCGLNAFKTQKDKNFLKWRKANAVLISHEHSDHTAYLRQFLLAYNRPPVVIHPDCLSVLERDKTAFDFLNSRFILLKNSSTYAELIKNRLQILTNNNQQQLIIDAFKVNHNASNNNGYVIQFINNANQCVFKTVYMTDCGSFDYGTYERLKPDLFAGVDCWLLEVNHLENLTPTDIREQRQFSDFGHFSRIQAVKFIRWLQRDFDLTLTQFLFIHTSATKYYAPEINDAIFRKLGVKFQRLKLFAFDEIIIKKELT